MAKEKPVGVGRAPGVAGRRASGRMAMPLPSNCRTSTVSALVGIGIRWRWKDSDPATALYDRTAKGQPRHAT
ncbi:hypothetical protein [Streptomyces sp. NPDC005374]|uniref:hypothetical protein n=1 Tax=Streptomyces sp. NPDC005374 TaxID=3364713 RepID=UPI0036D02C07